MSTEILIVVIVAGLLTGLLVLGAVVVGAWIGYRVKTQGDNLLRQPESGDDSVAYMVDDVGGPERPGRSRPSILSEQMPGAGMDVEELEEQAASEIIAAQNQRMLQQVLAMKATMSPRDNRDEAA